MEKPRAVITPKLIVKHDSTAPLDTTKLYISLYNYKLTLFTRCLMHLISGSRSLSRVRIVECFIDQSRPAISGLGQRMILALSHDEYRRKTLMTHPENSPSEVGISRRKCCVCPQGVAAGERRSKSPLLSRLRIAPST